MCQACKSFLHVPAMRDLTLTNEGPNTYLAFCSSTEITGSFLLSIALCNGVLKNSIGRLTSIPNMIHFLTLKLLNLMNNQAYDWWQNSNSTMFAAARALEKVIKIKCRVYSLF